MNRILISAAHKSSGKTTVTIGLCAAMTEKNITVQPFKKGPDYIDPMWLGMASGRPCYNLDFYISEAEEIGSTFLHRCAGAEFAVIEGNKGLYDGVALDGSNSNAALAKLLRTPVVLVIDTRGITRGIAPLLKGYAEFDQEIEIAGVVLNQVGGSRHEAKLRAAVEYYTDIPVLGSIYRQDELVIDERHLGLIPSNESADSVRIIRACAKAVADGLDIDRILHHQPPPLRFSAAANAGAGKVPGAGLKIGIARDAAFGFYYPEDLEEFDRLGVELIDIDTINDTSLPNIDGLFIGGGFPETHIAQLQANTTMRESIRQAIESGLPVYAECGGMMYLSESIHWNGKSGEMVGVIPAVTRMHDRPVGRGYTRLQETSDHSWPGIGARQQEFTFPAHEFHHSSLEMAIKNPIYAYRVLRGTGITGENDGFVYKNLLATYAHQRNVAGNPWVGRFVEFVRKISNKTATQHETETD